MANHEYRPECRCLKCVSHFGNKETYPGLPKASIRPNFNIWDLKVRCAPARSLNRVKTDI